VIAEHFLELLSVSDSNENCHREGEKRLLLYSVIYVKDGLTNLVNDRPVTVSPEGCCRYPDGCLTSPG
jgi:hypothetical protein